MTRTLTRACLFLLLALPLSACTTTHRDVAVITACLAGIPALAGLVGFVGCEVGGAFKQVSVETSEAQLVAPADSTRKVEADGICLVWNAQKESVSSVGTLSLRGLTGRRVQYALVVPGVPALPVSLKRGCHAFLFPVGDAVGAGDFRT